MRAADSVSVTGTQDTDLLLDAVAESWNSRLDQALQPKPLTPPSVFDAGVIARLRGHTHRSQFHRR